MTQGAKDKWNSAIVGVIVGLVVIFGSRAIDSLINTDTIKDIKQDLKEIRNEIRDMRSQFVLKSDYENDKKIIWEVLNKK